MVCGWRTVRELIEGRLISAGHDRSDGGLITTLSEMAFSGNCGIDVNISDDSGADAIAYFFAEELGLVLEVKSEHQSTVVQAFEQASVPCQQIGSTTDDSASRIRFNGQDVVNEETGALRDLWEETSFRPR